MTPLVPRSIQARRQPVAIAFVFLTELAWALLVATPTHAWARRVWGGHPDGDGVLFANGGRDLLVWLGQNDAALSVAARTTIVLLVVGAVLVQLPFAALGASLAFGRVVPAANERAEARIRSLRLRSALAIGVTAFLPLAVLFVLGSVATAIVLVVGALAASSLDSALEGALGDAHSFAVHVVVLAVFAAFAAVIGIVVDLARAAVVREAGLSAASRVTSPAWFAMLRGVQIALKTSRAGLRRATLAWTGRAIVGVALVAIGYVAADVLGGTDGLSLALLFVVHQAVVLGRVALRASWTARALALVAPVQDALQRPSPVVASDL